MTMTFNRIHNRMEVVGEWGTYSITINEAYRVFSAQSVFEAFMASFDVS